MLGPADSNNKISARNPKNQEEIQNIEARSSLKFEDYYMLNPADSNNKNFRKIKKEEEEKNLRQYQG